VPRGGRRVGAGRKRKSAAEHWLSGDAGKRGLSLVPPREESGDVEAADPPKADVVPIGEAPAVLTVAERPFWDWYSPQALAKGTLTKETTPGFVLLCQVAARRARLWAQIDTDGDKYEAVVVDGAGQERVSLKAHPLLTHARGLDMRLEQHLARFGITSGGKAEGDKKPKKDDEREQLRKLLAVR
jgi:hypothetical protein